MSRLTEKDDQGNWALWKLMDYEDTGLSPDDMATLQYAKEGVAEKVIEKLEGKKNPMYREDGSLMAQKMFIRIDEVIEIVKQFTN